MSWPGSTIPTARACSAPGNAPCTAMSCWWWITSCRRRDGPEDAVPAGRAGHPLRGRLARPRHRRRHQVVPGRQPPDLRRYLGGCPGRAALSQRPGRVPRPGTRHAPRCRAGGGSLRADAEMGLKTLYQPAAQVIHYEGVSHGRDTAVGIKSYQAVNRRTFVDTWADVLAGQHYPNGQGVFRARERAMHRDVVLVVDHFVPTPRWA